MTSPGNFFAGPRVKSGEEQVMAMMLGNGRGPRADINITPMIDVLLVLIIIFMVITPVAPRGFETLVPQPAAGGSEQPEALVVTVSMDGMTLNRQPLTLEGLRDRLTELFALAPSRLIFVRGEGGIEFARVAEVIDIARAAGMNRVALMTER
jgi:biopolymer transport protein TolR